MPRALLSRGQKNLLPKCYSILTIPLLDSHHGVTRYPRATLTVAETNQREHQRRDQAPVLQKAPTLPPSRPNMSRGYKMSSTKRPDKSSVAQPHVKYLTNYSSVAHPPLDSATGMESFKRGVRREPMLYITLALWVASTNLAIQEQFERKTAGQDSMTRRLRMVREDTGRDLAKVPPRT